MQSMLQVFSPRFESPSMIEKGRCVMVSSGILIQYSNIGIYELEKPGADDGYVQQKRNEDVYVIFRYSHSIIEYSRQGEMMVSSVVFRYSRTWKYHKILSIL
jgi:hypothetical protein